VKRIFYFIEFVSRFPYDFNSDALLSIDSSAWSTDSGISPPSCSLSPRLLHQFSLSRVALASDALFRITASNGGKFQCAS